MSQHIPLSRRIRYGFEAAMAYLFYGFFAVLPMNTASNVGGFLLRTIGPKLGASKKARRHIAFALPELTAEEQEQVVIDMWDNLGRVLAEYPHLPNLIKNIEFIGDEHLRQASESQKGALFVAGHFANWEIGATSARHVGFNLDLVYRKPNNPYVDGLLRRARRRAGARSNIAKSAQGARRMIRTLKGGDILGVLMDQKNNKGVPIPFFGADAMTSDGPIAMALKVGVPIYPVQLIRTQGAHFQLIISPAMDIPHQGSLDARVEHVLLALHGLFEGWIRQHPSQWLWLHRRWPKDHPLIPQK